MGIKTWSRVGTMDISGQGRRVSSSRWRLLLLADMTTGVIMTTSAGGGGGDE
mgnify:CR=1 FL=1